MNKKNRLHNRNFLVLFSNGSNMYVVALASLKDFSNRFFTTKICNNKIYKTKM